MLDGLWIATAAPAVEAALASMAATGPVAVLATPRLARALTARGRSITAVGADAADALVELGRAPPFAAVIGVGVGARADWAATLAAWATATADGGGLVLVDRGAAVELSRRALCAGLTALEQRVAGRWIVTSGLVSRL
ncbi:MAG: hypothetical protein IPL61_34280 [Myxococcales bacterium]|nr:hypothetical protein [Myxococcales bacterium]